MQTMIDLRVEPSPDAGVAVPLEWLEAEICTLAAHIAAATYRFLVLLGEFDRREGWAVWEVASCAHWLNWKCSMSLRTAREHLSVARRLDDLPVTAAAMARGELSFSKVRAICRMATPATEAGLVVSARYATAAHLERLARLYRRATGRDELDADTRAEEHRQVTIEVIGDGTAVVTARVHVDEAAVIEAALRAAMDVSGEPVGARPVAVRRADALVAVCDGYLARPEHAHRGDRYQVVMHVDEAVVSGDGHGRCGTDSGHAVSAATARRVLCDADVVRVIDGADGAPVAVSGKTRRITTRLRRVLLARDGHCRFPGCTHRHVDAHHLRHWIDGGATRLDNLLLLCRRHHRLVHHQHWTIESVEGRLRFRHPAGWIYGETEPVACDPDRLFVDQQDLAIRADSIQTEWQNWPIDWDTWLHTITNGTAEPPPMR